MEAQVTGYGLLDSEVGGGVGCPPQAPGVLHLSSSLDGQQRAWALSEPIAGIGRSRASAVHIDDATVSKIHAEIVRKGGRWIIRDLRSRNGTRVNGSPVAGEVPLESGDEVCVGRVPLSVTIEDSGAPLRLTASPDLTTTLRVSARQVLRSQARAQADEARIVQLLTEAGRLLILPRPIQDLGDEVLRIVEKAIPASRLILLLRQDGESEPVQVSARCRGGSATAPLVLSRAILRSVLDGCASVITTDAMADPRFMERASIVQHRVRAAMAVPLFDNQRVLGLLYADHDDPGICYGKDHLEILTLFANMAAVKISNVQLLKAEELVIKLEQELAAAARIQRHLLPAAAADIPGYGCHARLEPCYEVGGDFYDFHPMPDGTVYFVLGDVAGKGLCAALLMSSALASLRALYEHCPDPGILASRLSDALWRHTEADRFVTAFIGRLDPGSGNIRYANAGHPPPLILADGDVRSLTSTGPPLGILEGLEFGVETARLDAGELFALFTDGIPDAKSGEEFFETKRLAAALMNGTDAVGMEELAARAIGGVDSFLGGNHREDDLAILLLRRDDRAGESTPERSWS